LSFERQNADVGGHPVPRDDPERAPAGFGDGWGWDLVQRDWSLRQGEPAGPRTGMLAGLRTRIEAAIARIRRLVGVALCGIVHGAR
jgi:hypothetical protein